MIKRVTQTLTGDRSGISGDCSKLRGDCSELRGDCSELRGDLDTIPLAERVDQPKLTDWIEP